MSSQPNQSNQPRLRVLQIAKDGRKHVYALTEADYLDLLRAVDREGPPKLGVAWTLLQRFGLLYPLYKSLSTFVRAYAQPINPDWFATGKRHLAEVKKLNGDLKAVAKENQQAALREQWASVPLSKISPDTIKVVDSIFEGVPSPIPGSTHYAAPITRQSEKDAIASRASFANRRNYSAIAYGNILTSNWFYGEAAMSGVRVSAMYGAATLAVVLLAFALTSGLGYGALHVLRRFV